MNLAPHLFFIISIFNAFDFVDAGTGRIRVYTDERNDVGVSLSGRFDWTGGCVPTGEDPFSNSVSSELRISTGSSSFAGVVRGGRFATEYACDVKSFDCPLLESSSAVSATTLNAFSAELNTVFMSFLPTGGTAIPGGKIYLTLDSSLEPGDVLQGQATIATSSGLSGLDLDGFSGEVCTVNFYDRTLFRTGQNCQ